MTTSNLKGGFVKSLTIARDGSSESITNLKNAFLKKTNNYVCQMTNFITNITPPLNKLDEIMFQIKAKGEQHEVPGETNFPDDWQVEWTRFRPKKHYSAMGLALQLEEFFHKFGFLVRKPGSDRIFVPFQIKPLVPFIKTNLVLQEPDSDDSDADSDAPPQYLDKGWGALNGSERIIKFNILPDGRFALVFTPEFSSNFYIKVGAQTQIYTGLPEFLFVTQFGPDSFTAEDGVEELIEPATGLFRYPPEVTTQYKYQSLFSFNTFDRRLSLDVVATFPLSNTISVVDGVPEHEYLLARFPLSDYKRFETDLKYTDNGISDETVISEDINVGLEDLTRGNPNITTVYLLPGNLQQVNLQLWTRYYNDGVVSRKETDMTNGFWSTKLLFSKKQT